MFILALACLAHAMALLVVVLFNASLSAPCRLQLSRRSLAGTISCLLLTGKGRGMVVTQDVKAGTLLAVCNPLAIAYIAPLDFGFQIDPVTMSMVGLPAS